MSRNPPHGPRSAAPVHPYPAALPWPATRRAAAFRAILEDGPATAPEVAAELGTSTHRASAYLAWLRRTGRIASRPYIHDKHPHTPGVIYYLQEPNA